MKTTLFAALGALVLAAGGAPAMAGGYWDGGFVHAGPPPADSRWDDDSCPCNCPDDQDYRDHDRGWREHAARGEEDRWSEREGWRGEDRDDDEDQIYTPMEFDGGVGPATFIDEGGGGSGAFAGANGIAVASAFASASASASVNVSIQERERMRHHDMMDHHMMDHDHMPMMPKHDYQPMQPMHGWGGMGGWGAMSAGHAMTMGPHMGGSMMMHRSGGGRRW